MRLFSVILEVQMPEDRAKEIESWNEDMEVSDFVDSVIKDHAKDRGLVIKGGTITVNRSIVNQLTEYQADIINHDNLDDLEEEILSGKACVNGNCED